MDDMESQYRANVLGNFNIVSIINKVMPEFDYDKILSYLETHSPNFPLGQIFQAELNEVLQGMSALLPCDENTKASFIYERYLFPMGQEGITKKASDFDNKAGRVILLLATPEDEDIDTIIYILSGPNKFFSNYDVISSWELVNG